MATVPALVRAQDTDSDGVDDTNDNCTLVANADQRDTDLDGIGSICDPDVNNDGSVNFLDLEIFKEAFFTPNIHTDLNNDGSTNFSDLEIVAAYFFGPPGPAAPDVGDSDGVPPFLDLCPDSPPGAVPITNGCSFFEIAEDPDQIMVDVFAMHMALSELIADNADIGFLRDDLNAFQAELEGAVAEIRQGDICGGTSAMFGASFSLTNIHTQLVGIIAAHEEELSTSRPTNDRDCSLPNPPDLCSEDADHTEEDAMVMSFRVAESLMANLHGALLMTTELFESACGNSSPGSAKGTVAAMELDRNRIFLTDGTYVGLADGVDLPLDVYPGREVVVNGTGFGSSLLADSLAAFGDQGALADFLNYETCVRLRFAPIQRFAPINTGPFTLHEPDAYLYEDGKYRVEHGMRLAAENVPFCGDSFGPFVVRYSLHVHIAFQTNVGPASWGSELDPAGQPVLLPPVIPPQSDATMTVSHRRQSCEAINLGNTSRAPGNTIFICSEQEQYATEQLILRVQNKGAYCIANFDRTEFSLEEVPTTTFAPTFVSGKQTILVVPDPGTNMTVVGEGYEVYSTTTSSFPVVKRIDEGEQFAVYEHDCVTNPNQLYTEGTCGTLSPSGLQWPRLEGVRNGLPFAYRCRLPLVVRDLIDECNPAPDSYYKLPFLGGFPNWTISQGNNGTFTHNGNQAFAFDFVNAAGSFVRAARGGLVTTVVENQTGNSYYDPGCSNCMANAVNIRHQDGTQSQYFHFLTNGVFVSQGQTVSRGDILGEVGNTGYSTGPHVHFHARFPSAPTIPVRFRSLDNGNTTPPDACYIPVSGDPLVSDNG